MIEFDLYNDVIIDFSKDEVFTRYTLTNNNLGEVEQSNPIDTTVFCYIHPANDRDLIEVSREGYHPESMIKIFSQVDADIVQDDEVLYSGLKYRVMKTNIKLVGDYKKLFAELLKQ